MIKDGEQHTIKDARPKRQSEGRAMELQGIKQHFQRTVSDVRPRVKREFRQTSQQREPEVHVLILVAELQALQQQKDHIA